MGKKLFRFNKEDVAVIPPAEEAARLGGGKGSRQQGLGQGDQAARLGSGVGSKMRELIKRDGSSDQRALLVQLESSEGASRFQEHSVDMHNIMAEPASMLKILSEQTGLPMIELNKFPRADLKLRALIPADVAKTYKVIPVEERPDKSIMIAIGDPSNPTIADDLRLVLGREVYPVIADEVEIKDRLEAYYGMGGETIEDLVEKENSLSPDEDVIGRAHVSEIDLSDLNAVANQAPVIKLVNFLLMRAINDRASDIHIEPFPSFIRIRYRVDGVLREIPSPERGQLVAIISRVKVMAVINIAESRLPQDGRIKLAFEGREIDLRVSTVPTVHGESVVMRVLDRSMMMIGIRNIGMLDEVLEKFIKIAHKPNGIVLCTGPTGCGKTTTLYSILREINDPGSKIITTEDPVEYELGGIVQVNINEAVGLTYARSLRAILRQDPDIVLVGEIRDVETAQTAVQASLTGHLVFSTLHTNSAAATVTRMLDMGVEPFLITSALEGVIGQRLLRTICQSCKQPYTPNEEDLMGFGVTRHEIEDLGITFHQGAGCPECSHSGYHGRMGIYELLEVDDDMREMILERATTDELHEAALRMGMISMRQDGWMKICMGLTTFHEVARQTPKDIPLSAGGTDDEESDAEPAKLPKKAPEALAPPPKSAAQPEVKQNPMIPTGEGGAQA